MIETIEKLEELGYHISIHPSMEQQQWVYKAGVYFGNDTKAKWINTDNGLPFACYSKYREAFDAIMNYCNDKKNKKK